MAVASSWISNDGLPLIGDSGEKPFAYRPSHSMFVCFVCVSLWVMSALTTEERNRVRDALGRTGGRPRITTEDGTVLDLPEPVADALAEVLAAAADGERALVLRSPDDLTTEQAAAVLGVSRPTVVRLIEAGKLPARMVNTHRRLTLGDVLAFREATVAKRRTAIDEM